MRFYHEWDLDEDVVPWNKVLSSDKGRYVKFDDGSELYAKILHCSSKVINTSAGMFRRADIIHCAVPRPHSRTVYGLRSGDVHPNVTPYTRWERRAANELVRTGDTQTHVTRRIRMRAQELLGEEAIRQGLTKEVFISRMIQEFNTREGRNFPVAAKFIGLAVFKTDITKPDLELGQGEGEDRPIMTTETMNLFEPSNGNKIATVRDIRKLVKVTRMQNAEQVPFEEDVENDIHEELPE